MCLIYHLECSLRLDPKHSDVNQDRNPFPSPSQSRGRKMIPVVVFCKIIQVHPFMCYFTTCWGVSLILINQADSPASHLSSSSQEGRRRKWRTKVPILWIQSRRFVYHFIQSHWSEFRHYGHA